MSFQSSMRPRTWPISFGHIQGATMKCFVRIFLLCMVSVSQGYSQDERYSLKALGESVPKVYIDCDRCDIDFIRTEVTFVNYVRDGKEAQVHILITTQRTGSGGTGYTVAFIGRGSYEGMNDTFYLAKFGMRYRV